MKQFLAIIIIIAVILSAGTFTLYHLKIESEEISGQLDRLEASVDSEQWQEAESRYAELSKIWHDKSSVWSMLVDHYEIDNISLSMAQLRAFIDSKDGSHALSSITSLKVLVQHIPDKEAPSIKNIL